MENLQTHSRVLSYIENVLYLGGCLKRISLGTEEFETDLKVMLYIENVLYFGEYFKFIQGYYDILKMSWHVE